MPEWILDTMKFIAMVGGAGLSAWAGFNAYTRRMATLTADTITAAVDQAARINELDRRLTTVERDHAENTRRIFSTLEALTERVDRVLEIVANK